MRWFEHKKRGEWVAHEGTRSLLKEARQTVLPALLRQLLVAARKSGDPDVREAATEYRFMEKLIDTMEGKHDGKQAGASGDDE